MAGVRSNKGEINTDGYYYQLYTLLHCIDRLRKIKYIQEYDIGNALIGFGALDDVVFNASTKSGRKTTTAIQVKHSNTNKMIDERYLCHDSRTCLHKYFESFVEIKKTTSEEQLDQLVLWTNMPVAANIRDWFEDFVPDSDESDILGKGSIEGLSYECYRIKSDYWQEIVKKCQEHVRKENEKVRIKKKKDNGGYSEEGWEQFFKRFVLYVNVPKVAELKAYLVKNIGNYFDDLCKLVESCAVKQIATSCEINSLFTLVNLRSAMEVGPYTKLIFNDLDELQRKVQAFFADGSKKILRVKASQDVDCTVARLITVVESCLAAESKRYLVFSFKTFKEKWGELQSIVNDSKLIEIGLKCLIIRSITEDEIRKIENQLSALKVIFVQSNFDGMLSKLETYLEDQFDINCIDNPSKDIIKNRKIKLSQCQVATVDEIFGKKMFLKENLSMILELYRLPKDFELQITFNEPSVDIHYLPRIAQLSCENNYPTKVDLQNQTDFCKLVICDQPGMGKTTEMIKLCSEFRAKFQDHLVVYLHCRVAVSKWKGSIEDLICNTVTSCSKLTKRVIERIIQIGKVILVMDGYDEVSQEYNDTLKVVVSEISRVQMFRLYIATRPQCKDEPEQM